jgi:hypothetical protein
MDTGKTIRRLRGLKEHAEEFLSAYKKGFTHIIEKEAVLIFPIPFPSLLICG